MMKHTTAVRSNRQLINKASVWVEIVAQAASFCVGLFNKNGLANHAAAGAYGFLFAGAPALLLISLMISRVMETSPESAAALLSNIALLGAFDMEHLVSNFFSSSQHGLTGVISIFGLFLTARIFALAIQRGLGIVLPDSEGASPVRKAAMSFIIEAILIIAIMSFLLIAALTHALGTLLIFALLACFVFCAYFFVPVHKLKAGAALTGCLMCMVCYALIFQSAHLIWNPATYRIRYGALGDIVLLLVNVYFFFTFFYMGAQMAFVIEHFDALLFSRLAQTKPVKASVFQAIFTSTRGPLSKYLHIYKAGEEIFHQGSDSKEVYYILKGQAAVFLDEQQVALVESGKFFGEMGHVLGESRSATLKAHTDMETLVLSPLLFEEVLRNDPDIDKRIINTFSDRLKETNKKLSTRTVPNDRSENKQAQKSPKALKRGKTRRKR
jgi:membrane protein